MPVSEEQYIKFYQANHEYFVKRAHFLIKGKGTKQDAEDIVGEVHEVCLKQLGEIRELSHYVNGVLSKKCNRFMRNALRIAILSLDKVRELQNHNLVIASEEITDENIVLRVRDDVFLKLQLLNEDQKQILLYRINTDLTYKQIEEETGILEKTLISRFHRAINEISEI